MKIKLRKSYLIALLRQPLGTCSFHHTSSSSTRNFKSYHTCCNYYSHSSKKSLSTFNFHPYSYSSIRSPCLFSTTNITPFCHHFHRTKIIMSANSSNQQDDVYPPSSSSSNTTSTITTAATAAAKFSSNFEKFQYPLIDVDCNLIHSDLISLLESPSSASPPSLSSQYFNILHHPSTKLSNIQGVFTPSSTIKEAEDFHNALIQYYNNNNSGNNGNDNENNDNIQIKMSIGIHPYHTNDDEISSSSSSSLETNTIQNNIKQRIQNLLSKDEQYNFITCIGELGLDYSDGFPNKDIQQLWFEYQLQIAKDEIIKNDKRQNLSLFIHERLAFHDTISIIDKVFPPKMKIGQPKIIIHCFTGNKQELQEYIHRDYYISLSGYILKNGDGPNEINQCLKDGIIPLHKLMIETDAPYMGFTNCRDTFYNVENEINQEYQLLKSKKKKSLVKSIYPNVPSALPKVLEHVVNVINEGRRERNEEELSVEFVASCLYENSKMFFGF